ncbi:MAG: DUF1080 domain-containing protein [Pirellulales bacterium]
MPTKFAISARIAVVVLIAAVCAPGVETISLEVAAIAARAEQEPADATLPPAEYGFGLTEDEAAEGWISLFDGQSDFGWQAARIENGRLSGGTTTSRFGSYELRAELGAAGTIRLGDEPVQVKRGRLAIRHAGTPGSIRLDQHMAVTSLVIRPLDMKVILDGRDLSAWRRVDRPGSPAAGQPEWRIEPGGLRAVGGPGALEYTGRPFDDFVLQIEARTLKPHANGGLFFRSQPGLFMMGYEAQIYNRCEAGDPARPWRYSTGAIDDRQLARRLVSRDGETFVMTVLADGPHVATWVNGYQTTDWTDDRPPHDNPREGLRLAAGTIQLQAHDRQTDLIFKRISVAPLGQEADTPD